MPKLFLILFLVSLSFARQAINYSYFEKEDKNKDGKLTINQFLDALTAGIRKGVIFK
jgi:hypothetical protein